MEIGFVTIFNDETIQTLFGKEDAENETPQRLKEYFFRNKAYDNLVANLPIRVLVGHKGTGKSALLKVAYNEDQDNNILSLWLRPDDVRGAAPTIASGDLNVRIEAWKKALTQLIAREIAETYADMAISTVKTEGTQGRLRDVVGIVKDIFSSQIDKGISKIRKSAIEQFQKTSIIRVYLDDLDRGWEAKPSDIRNISALLNAIRDLCGSRNTLQFRLGLRSDVYYLVRTSDESVDKIEANIIFLTWDNHQILIVAAKRIESFVGRELNEAKLLSAFQSETGRYLHPVIEPFFAGVGKWEHVPIHRVLLSLVRRRPRDLVKLLSGAAREAYKNNQEIITSGDLRSTFEAYSNERLQDLVNEFRTELPNVSNLIRGMRPLKRERYTIDQFRYSNDQLSKNLRDLNGQNQFMFADKKRADMHSLGQFFIQD
jgi:hypothetical protein